MTTCATCARALQPTWKFCIYCGTPTGITEADPATVDEPTPPVEPVETEDLSEPESDDLDGDEFDLVDYDAEVDDLRTVDGPESDADPEPPAAGTVRSRPLPAPVDLSGGFDHLEADEDDGYPFDDDEPIDLPDEDAPTPSIASLAAGLPEPAAVDPDESTETAATRDRVGSVNVLAIIALALGVLVSPLAALFGHLALNQLKTSGEKGVVPAWIAIVLGYVWLGAAIVLGITYFATNA